MKSSEVKSSEEVSEVSKEGGCPLIHVGELKPEFLVGNHQDSNTQVFSSPAHCVLSLV